MAGSDGKIMLLIGEAFIETNEDEANECKIMFTSGEYILEQLGNCIRKYHNPTPVRCRLWDTINDQLYRLELI
jgi:hypothetical protein